MILRYNTFAFLTASGVMSVYKLAILWWTGDKVNRIRISIGEAGVKRCVLRSRNKTIQSNSFQPVPRERKDREREEQGEYFNGTVLFILGINVLIYLLRLIVAFLSNYVASYYH